MARFLSPKNYFQDVLLHALQNLRNFWGNQLWAEIAATSANIPFHPMRGGQIFEMELGFERVQHYEKGFLHI